MTYIQPKASDFNFRLAVILLMSTVVLLAVYLMIIYSQTVSLASEIQSDKLALKKALIESAELKNQIFGLVTDEFLRVKASELGLVEDKTPAYFELQKQWLFASQ